MKTSIRVIVSGCLLAIGLHLVLLPGKTGGASEKLSWTTRVTRYVQHTVQSDDTLDVIARLYGTTVAKILVKNDMLPGDRLLVGERLQIPVDGYKARMIL